MEFRKLAASEIEVRVKQVIKGGAIALLYKTARTDMDLLDETVGAENWYKTYEEIKGNLYCTLFVRCGNQWVGKQDCGIESRTDGDGNEKKGEASDAFKRAGFCWGIGRELYTAPFILLDLPREETERNGRKGWQLKGSAYPTVSEIKYENGKISKLVICNRGKVIWVFPAADMPDSETPDETPGEAARLQATILSLADGDVERVDRFVDRLWPGTTLQELTVPQLRTLKVQIAKKVQQQ